MRTLPTGTVTFLFTDIEGSTRLLEQLGTEAYAQALAAHRRVIRAACSSQGGVEVDTEGDAFFVAFPTAQGALSAAAAFSEGLAEGPVRVRVGVHTGTPLVAEDHYVGMDVHRAARIAAAGHGGQVLVSSTTAALTGMEGLRDLGEHRFKDLSAPERVYQLGEGEFPRLKTLYQTNLPVPATPFLGREAELAEAGALLLDGVRLLTLSGPGGTGKTRLALQAAAAAADGYPDGIWWVPLAPLSDPSLVLPTAGELLGAHGELAPHIADKRLLLLFDNFEHLIEASAEIGALIGACPQLTMLVTSRERLQIAGEHEYPVPALAATDGLELFAARARALGVELDGDPSAAELCARLDHLPLALELAAARTKLFSPAQLLERLGQRLDLFKGGRDADPRQRTLRATIEWSHDLLTQEEQELFARLSVFAGGCTYEAAEEICHADEDTLQSLLDKSLLRRGEERYWMLETIREFAAERLADHAEREPVAQRHASWYADLAERLQRPLRDGDLDATARLTVEIDNIRGALEWSARHGDVRQALRIVDGLWYLWITRGLAAEGLRWGRWAFEQAPKAPPKERVFGLLDASELFRFFGDAELALQLKRQLLPELRELGPESEVAATMEDISDMLATRGEFDQARRLAGEALALRRRVGDPWGIGRALVQQGLIEFHAGDFSRAREWYEEAIAFGKPIEVAGATLMAGESARRAGDPGGAAPLLLRALPMFQEFGQRFVFPELLQEVAAAIPCRPVEAVQLLGASERLRREMGLVLWDAADYERTVVKLRTELGDDAFEEAWAEGAALSEDEALSLAARCLD
jgi:predicted ATPase